MRREAVYHAASDPWIWPESLSRVRVRIRVGKGDVKSCRVGGSDRYVSFEENAIWTEAEKIATDDLFDWFEASLDVPSKRLQYQFRLETANGEVLLCGERGIGRSMRDAGVFQFAYLHESGLFQIPEWAGDAVVYQIFPDRFARGKSADDPVHAEPWSPDARPRPDSVYGGDLAGVIDKLPHLRDLGVNTIYFTPLFLSPSNHKYDTEDYFRIDPSFGDLRLFRELVDRAHRSGIRVILDAVFNHCGDRFFAFRDVLANGPRSRYKDWFFIDRFPVEQEPEPTYETFANGVTTMPKLRTEHPEVRRYLLNVARFWTETGIDGWRLDVANEVDHAFWREFRQTVKAVRADILIVGEIWHDAGEWLRGDRFDSVMNYPFRDCVVRFFAEGSIDAQTFDEQLCRIRMRHPEPVHRVMWNLIGSHDTERFLTLCGGDDRKMKLALLFLLTWQGVPMLYYGDEVGMQGGPDPDCRRPMIWDPEAQNRGLLEFVQRLIRLRNRLTPLRRGRVRTWHADRSSGIFAFIRKDESRAVGIVLNNGDQPRTVKLPVEPGIGPDVRDLLGGRRHTVTDGELSVDLGPYEGAVFEMA
ncbi:glycoside hydrolase family 13 protein [Staphylospora marina]|uniref:glycoside hydrolase family 13 protein n=1 Tax=Staphylospora marina TaxID=2490858 RepID=UPI000F5BB087|nr:glycoside hydrolase family 13 protein [Staphylospora marina]